VKRLAEEEAAEAGVLHADSGSGDTRP